MLSKSISKEEVLRQFRGYEEWDGTNPISSVAETLREILAEPQISYFLKLCEWNQLEDDPEHFEAVCAEKGLNFTTEEVRDALLELAAILAPETEAGRRDVRDELFATCLRYLNDEVGDIPVCFEMLEQGLADIWCDEDLLTFRLHLRKNLRDAIATGRGWRAS